MAPSCGAQQSGMKHQALIRREISHCNGRGAEQPCTPRPPGWPTHQQNTARAGGGKRDARSRKGARRPPHAPRQPPPTPPLAPAAPPARARGRRGPPGGQRLRRRGGGSVQPAQGGETETVRTAVDGYAWAGAEAAEMCDAMVDIVGLNDDWLSSGGLAPPPMPSPHHALQPQRSRAGAFHSPSSCPEPSARAMRTLSWRFISEPLSKSSSIERTWMAAAA